MCLLISVYPLPQRTFSVHINGDRNHVSRYKSYYSMSTGLNRRERSNILDLAKATQGLPLPNSGIGAFEPSLYCTIIHPALILLAQVK